MVASSSVEKYSDRLEGAGDMSGCRGGEPLGEILLDRGWEVDVVVVPVGGRQSSTSSGTTLSKLTVV